MASKNVGKRFEDNFKSSVPEYCLVERFKDTAQSYNKTAKFTTQNPCDFLLFDTLKKDLYYLELKSTKYTNIPYDDISLETEQGKMIKKHQILSLIEKNEYDNVHGAFLLNFRDEKNDMERTYYLGISDFMKIYHSSNKKSINEIDILMNGGIKVNGEKKRVNYKWDIDSLLNKLRKSEE